ncbi:riboflavine-aldehyde-forming enzyme [Mycena latifolia]|nr:riboflavine-aldehyde-forming enzyme [Mycena latifolia]
MHFFKCIASLTGFIAVASAITDQATFFEPGGAVGVCGRAIQNSDLAVALSPANFASGTRCNGKSVSGTVEDECFECSGNGVDLTSGAFQVLAPLSVGIVTVTYTL